MIIYDQRHVETLHNQVHEAFTYHHGGGVVQHGSALGGDQVTTGSVFLASCPSTAVISAVT